MTSETKGGGTQPDVVTIGAATIDRHYLVSNLPKPDGGAYAETVETAFGGVAANVGVGCSRLGQETGLIARLGNDSVGDEIREDLRSGPLDTTRVRQRSGTSTHCVILRDEEGSRSIVTAGDSTVRLRLSDADRDYLAGTHVVFVTAYAPDPVHQALLGWHDTGQIGPLVFDLSGPLAELEDRGARETSVDAMVQEADLFVVGAVAANSYLGKTGREAAAELREMGVTRAAVTSGAAGATLVSEDGRLVEVPAFSVDVTDETGAGDAFVAGLIDAWLLRGETPAKAGRFAAAVAGLNCREAGARGGLPTRPAVESWLDTML